MNLDCQSVHITKSKLCQRLKSSPDIIVYNARALTLQALHGRSLIASDFILNVDALVLMYFYGRPTIYGTGAYVDGSDLIVSQEDGQVTVPLYIVSQGKERTSRDKLFPTAPRSNDLRGEIICTGWHAAAPNPSMTPAATAVDTTAT